MPLNVAQLIENGDHHDGLVGLDYVLDEINDRYEPADCEHGHIELEQEAAAAVSRYAISYQAYGASFASVVRLAAEAIGLDRRSSRCRCRRRPEEHLVGQGATRNPVEWDCDELISRLWNNAHDVVPLPNVDIRSHSHSGPGDDDHD